jgi:hypothetical protein
MSPVDHVFEISISALDFRIRRSSSLFLSQPVIQLPLELAFPEIEIYDDGCRNKNQRQEQNPDSKCTILLRSYLRGRWLVQSIVHIAYMYLV